MHSSSTVVRDSAATYTPHEHEELLGAARRERERVRRFRLLAKHSPKSEGSPQRGTN
ncbi:MAG: hypothetical protein QOJ31_500 [Gaiellales bacterium]|nr:hypothetical protein [Gaiellales bacterium]MDX6544478.1 hypothetical protein [Gaiellales bacterium]MDX6549816.1 hypothetical protein [Gaiellales bacterium]